MSEPDKAKAQATDSEVPANALTTRPRSNGPTIPTDTGEQFDSIGSIEIKLRARARERLERRLLARGRKSLLDFQNSEARAEEKLRAEISETNEENPRESRQREAAILKDAGVQPPSDFEKWVVRVVGLSNRIFRKSVLLVGENCESICIRANPENFERHDFDSTGFRIWESSFALSHLLSNYRPCSVEGSNLHSPKFSIQNKRICELGCGMAIPSIVAAKRGARQVVATDLDSAALETVNVNRVLLSIGDVMTTPKQLAFGNEQQILKARGGSPFDLVFAVDLFYTNDKTFLRKIALTIVALIATTARESTIPVKVQEGCDRSDVVAIIGYWERGCCPLSDFTCVLDELSQHGLFWRRIRGDGPCDHARLHLYEVHQPQGTTVLMPSFSDL